jgi:hypothetical protein
LPVQKDTNELDGHSSLLLKYAARISEAREQHQSKFAFDLGELERENGVGILIGP